MLMARRTPKTAYMAIVEIVFIEPDNLQEPLRSQASVVSRDLQEFVDGLPRGGLTLILNGPDQRVRRFGI
jgi:hypothetical protein